MGHAFERLARDTPRELALERAVEIVGKAARRGRPEVWADIPKSRGASSSASATSSPMNTATEDLHHLVEVLSKLLPPLDPFEWFGDPSQQK